MNKLAIITSHPIQYNAPLFRLLAQEESFEVEVFYTLGKDSSGFTDPGFKKAITWDIPLLEGYTYQFVKNISGKPSTSHFKGVINPDLIKNIEDFGATDILLYGWSFNSHLKVLNHFKNKVRVYFRGDSTLLDEKWGIKTLVRRLALKWIYRKIDAVLYVGTNNKNYFLKHGVPEHKLFFAPHAIDNGRFGNDLEFIESAKTIRESLAVSPEKVLFLFTGKFENKKSPLLLIRAFKLLNLKNVALLFVGNGKLEDELKKEAEEFDNIKFLPFQNQTKMPAIYRAADVLVLPSGGPSETWGLCINEAMASGLPVIASNKVGCAIDLIQENVNGAIFESGNIISLIDNLKKLASKSKVELKEMGNASKNIISDWNYQNVLAAIISLIRKN